MKDIKIWYVDFWKSFDFEHNKITKILKKKYNVIFDKENPDFVICSCFGEDFLNYSCVRVMYLGEAITPDFNFYDYGIGFDYIDFGKRYIRYPYWLLDDDMIEMAIDRENAIRNTYKEKKFCNCVVSNGCGGYSFREEFFDKLSRYIKVDSGGRYLNNLENKEPVKNKLEFQRNYRFSLAFENSSLPGYTTEKIIDAWAAGTIPIYWGDPEVQKQFNPEAFLAVEGENDIDAVINKIIEINENEALYEKMVHQPIFTEQQYRDYLRYDEDLLAFFENIISTLEICRPCFKTIRGRVYENRANVAMRKDHSKLIGWIDKIMKRFV